MVFLFGYYEHQNYFILSPTIEEKPQVEIGKNPMEYFVGPSRHSLSFFLPFLSNHHLTLFFCPQTQNALTPSPFLSPPAAESSSPLPPLAKHDARLP